MSKVVLITGGTSGIGETTARLCASQGWNVIISGRNVRNGTAVVESIRNKGHQATFLESGLSSQDAVRDLHSRVLKAYGRLDGAVNNAGTSNDTALIGDASTESFEEMWRVNVLALFWCMQEQLRIMLPQNSGHIVNLASIAGLHGIANSGTYCATKHAVVGLTRSAALEYAKSGILITGVAPGAIRTKILDYALESGAYTEETVSGMSPLKRLGKPMDIAKAILFLLESDYTTGSILEVDGGVGAS